MKILIIKRDKLGDLLLTTPLLHHLKAALSGAEIHLLANDYNAWVVRDNPHIDRLWVYRRVKVGKTLRPGALWSELTQHFALRRAGFDVAIVAGGEESPRAIERALRVKARRVISYCDDPRLARRLTDPLPTPTAGHELERMLALAAPLGVTMPAHAALPTYTLPVEWAAWTRGWLAEQGVSDKGYVVLGLGARRAKKQPTADQVLRWAAYLKERQGLDTVFMWTPGGSDNPLYPGDDAVAEPVLARRPPYLHPFRGPLMPAIGLIWGARGSIFPDSGLMHFAAASPGGVIGLFAEPEVSPPPERWGPRGARADYLMAPKAVAELTDAQVFERLEWLLGGR